MFDYQAGEKYKLTLIITGVVGVIIGVFFTSILMPPPSPQHVARQRPKWADHPDVTGRGSVNDGPRAAGGYVPTDGVNTAPPEMQQNYSYTDPMTAMQLIEQWLPVAWDLSAGSAKSSQEKAIRYMTTDCASAYQKSVWTPEIAQQIEASGLHSTFKTSSVKVGATKPDGAVVILVEGEQVLQVPGKGSRARPVKLEYLVKKTDDGLRIAGISEGNQLGS